MSASQRTKGAAYEREIAAVLNEYGADASRNLTQCRDGGWDLDTLFGHVECKRRSKLPTYLRLADNVRFAVCRANRGESYVLLRLRDAAKLMRGERRGMREEQP